MRIAVDAMGGDLAPEAPVQGAIAAVERDPEVEVLLVGPPDRIGALLGPWSAHPRIGVRPADEAIGMNEPPVAAVRRKPNSSMVQAVRAVKEGQAAAAISAGNTGALMAAGLLWIGRIQGVERPALTAILPSMVQWGVLVLDVGANMDPKPIHLVQYAVMGALYCEEALNLAQPRVGLLNVGEEAGKGPPAIQEVHRRLSESGLRFVGNVEARELLQGKADVVVCEGFVGNVVLKLTEGLARDFLGEIRAIASRTVWTRWAGWVLRPGLRRMFERLDYQAYGGAPLLGLDGIVYKCHGSSEARAFAAAITVAHNFARKAAYERIRARLGQAQEGLGW
ncbi:MAG: phosphate acyltransferase PlsX [Firmicutes bacterium]|nr:phosphate acyltransferase PlsX [Alicyclobacillaceae bacterium]MCL6496379.1 phosphate acyltransferase PlsX [Bacillota bacterium]